MAKGIGKIEGLRFGQKLGDSSYVSDKFFNLIGWYDFRSEVFHIMHNYEYISAITKHCKKNRVEYDFVKIDQEVIDQYKERKLQHEKKKHEELKRKEEALLKKSQTKDIDDLPESYKVEDKYKPEKIKTSKSKVKKNNDNQTKLF